jgi:hypothetical protein
LLRKPPRALQESIVSQRMNKTGVGDDDTTTSELCEETLF